MGEATGVEDVEAGLDAIASALSNYLNLDVGAAPLDQVLAELGKEGELVETAADLIELVGRSSYAGGLNRVEARKAERLRGHLCEALEDLLNEIEQEQQDA